MVKVAGAYSRQPYDLHVPIVMKSGSLKLLEPSGPLQTCTGITLLSTDHVLSFLAHYVDVCNAHLARIFYVFFLYIFPLRRNSTL
jgi:hypothetical protein